MLRRDKMGIVLTILDICRNSRISKTRIFYAANINFKVGSAYLDFLIGNGLIVQEGKYYSLTDKGYSLLAAAKRVEEVLNSDNLKPSSRGEAVEMTA